VRNCSHVLLLSRDSPLYGCIIIGFTGLRRPVDVIVAIFIFNTRNVYCVLMCNWHWDWRYTIPFRSILICHITIITFLYVLFNITFRCQRSSLWIWRMLQHINYHLYNCCADLRVDLDGATEFTNPINCIIRNRCVRHTYPVPWSPGRYKRHTVTDWFCNTWT
jgi:hypothetical protein